MDYRTRAQWGAEFDVTTLPVVSLPRPYLFIHHNVIAPTSNPNSDMLRTEQVDIGRFGKPSYKWAVHPTGVVLEGTTIHRSPDTYAHNDDLSVMFMGNFENDVPTDAAMYAGRELVARIISYGWLTAGFQLLGHRDVYSTACPGANLYPRIHELLVPPLPQPSPTPGDDEVPKARYMRPKDDPGVALVFDTGAIVPVSNFANTEEVYVKQMGVVVVPYPVSEDVTDSAGNTRKVWVTDDAGLSKAIKRATT